MNRDGHEKISSQGLITAAIRPATNTFRKRKIQSAKNGASQNLYRGGSANVNYLSRCDRTTS